MDKTPYQLIQSFDESVWRQGLQSLGVEHTLDAANAIIDLLSDKIWRKREVAARTLIEWGPEIVPLIAGRLSAGNNDELYWVLHVLGHFEETDGRAIVLDHLKSDDAEVRGYAVRAIAISSNLENARILYPFLSDPNWAVRKLVFERLLSYGRAILPDLRTLLEKNVEDPAHSVVALFVKIGGVEVLTELETLYQQGSFPLRYSITVALSACDANESVDFLIQALSDPSWVIRKKSAEILSAMGNRVFERLSSWFGRGDSLMKYQIINIIVELLGEKAIPLMRRLLSSNDHEFRILAIESLSKLPGDESSRLLIKSLGDPYRIVADYASECLSRKAKLNLDLLLEHLNTSDENVRFLVIKTVGTIGGMAFNPIIRILQDGNKQERLFLLGVLQKITPNEKLIDVLIQLLADPSWPVRNAAGNCLKSYGEKAVSAIVRVLNSPNDDVQFWSRKVLLSLGPAAVNALTGILSEGSDASLIPHIVSALLAMDHSDAVPAVLQFLLKNDDSRIKAVFEGISEIASREVIDTILNLLNHPEERVGVWLSFLLRKVQKPNLRRVVMLGLNHSEERCRYLVIEVCRNWENLAEPELKTVLRQLEVEKTPRAIEGVVKTLAKNPVPFVIEAIRTYFMNLEPSLMLHLMLQIALAQRPQFNAMLAELLRTRSQVIREADVELVGKIMGVIFKSRPEGIIQGLSSPTMAYRLCSVVALEQIEDKRIAFALMDNLRATEDPIIVKRAVKILARHFFSDDFRLKGAVTDYLLNLGKIISEPLNEVVCSIENEIDRKALVDLVESVGGIMDPNSLKKKGAAKVQISDAVLDDVLERRKRAMEELEKYDKIIQTSHTQELTIMFTDVKGYTAFSSKASLSEVMSMLKQHDELLMPILEKHTGRVLKKIGDAFLIVFEQPAKAVLAAIEAQRKLREFNSEVPDERRLAVRIAINTGPVIRKEADVFGDAVNVASRLEGIADAEEIVLSEATFKHVDSGVFDIIPFGEHQLKGIEKPVKTYKVNW